MSRSTGSEPNFAMTARRPSGSGAVSARNARKCSATVISTSGSRATNASVRRARERALLDRERARAERGNVGLRMTLDDLLLRIAAELPRAEEREVAIPDPALLAEVRSRGWMRVSDFVADTRQRREKSTARTGHVL